MIVNSLLLPAIEEVGACISQRAISAYAMHYSKLDQIVNVFINVLSEWSLTRT